MMNFKAFGTITAAGVGSYLILGWLGLWDAAKETVMKEAVPQVKLILTGTIAYIFELLRRKFAIEPINQPEPKPDPVFPAPEQGETVAKERLVAAEQELLDWRIWGKKIEAYIANEHDKLNDLLVRRVVLKISLYGAAILAILLLIAGFIAQKASPILPPPPTGPTVSVALSGIADKSAFLVHQSILLVAFVIVGIGIGCAVFKVQPITKALHVRKCALIAALMTSTCAMLVSFPYVMGRMWTSNIEIFGANWPMLVWLLLSRVILGPLMTWLFASTTYFTLDKLLPNNHNRVQ